MRPHAILAAEGAAYRGSMYKHAEVLMDWSQLTYLAAFVLLLVLIAEAGNAVTDAPVGTSSAVASGLLTSKEALWITAVGNFVGLMLAFVVGAKVAQTIGTGIVRPDVVTIPAIGIAMATSIAWSGCALFFRLPVSKTHTLLASLAGIGYALGGFEALTPASGNMWESGWKEVAYGMGYAFVLASSFAFLLTRLVETLRLDERIPDIWWRRAQKVTVAIVGTGHGLNDGLKYYGIGVLVLYKAGVIKEFQLVPSLLVVCAFVMGTATLIGGWRIHARLDEMVNGGKVTEKKHFRPYMGVCAELVSGFLIWNSGRLGIPMSTNHGMVSAMAGAKSSTGRVHISSFVKICWGWVLTYVFCFAVSEFLTRTLLM